MTVAKYPVKRRVFLCRPSQSVSFGITMRSYIGCSPQISNFYKTKQGDLLSSEQIYINSVAPNSYAYYAGIKVGDQILGINGSYQFSYEDIRELIQTIACRIVLDLLSNQITNASEEFNLYSIDEDNTFIERTSATLNLKRSPDKCTKYSCTTSSFVFRLIDNFGNSGQFSDCPQKSRQQYYASSPLDKDNNLYISYASLNLQGNRRSQFVNNCPNNFNKIQNSTLQSMIKRQPSYLNAIYTRTNDAEFQTQKQRSLFSRSFANFKQRSSLNLSNPPDMCYSTFNSSEADILSVLCRSNSQCNYESPANVDIIIPSPQYNCNTEEKCMTSSTSKLYNYQHRGYTMTVGLCTTTSGSSLNTCIPKLPYYMASPKNSIMDNRIPGGEVVLKEGLIYCKTVSVSHRKAADRSWHSAYAVLHRSGDLFLCKDKQNMKVVGKISAAQVLMPLTNVPFPLSVGGDKGVAVQLALDYKKKQRVFRLSSIDQGTELLLHTGDLQGFCEWLYELRRLCGYKSDTSESCRQKVQSKTVLTQLNKITTNVLPQPANITKRKFVSSPLIRRGMSGCLRRGILTNNNAPMQPNDYRSTNDCKENTKSCNFNISLQRCQKSITYPGVPLVIVLLSKLIEQFGLCNVGVYRQTGSIQTTNWMIEQLDKGLENADFDDIRWQDMKAVASTLKTFFARLPECLFGQDLYLKLLECARNTDENKFPEKILKLVLTMDYQRQATLIYILNHFKVITSMSNLNKVDVKNIAIIFGPTLLWHSNRAPEESLAENPEKVHLIETLVQNIEYFADKMSITFTKKQINLNLNKSSDEYCSRDVIKYILKKETE